MRWEFFVKKYMPVKNDLIKGAALDGYMFETYGKERAAVQEFADATAKGGKNGYYVWTVVDGEGKSMYVLNGWHFINRLGYIITKHPWKEGEEIDIKV